jgi:hypothetical protein
MNRSHILAAARRQADHDQEVRAREYEGGLPMSRVKALMDLVGPDSPCDGVEVVSLYCCVTKTQAFAGLVPRPDLEH